MSTRKNPTKRFLEVLIYIKLRQKNPNPFGLRLTFGGGGGN